MVNIKNFLTFVSSFKYGYKNSDKIKIFLHNILYIIFYPINRFSFIHFKRNIIHPKILFNGFKVKNSDGLFICRDNVDLDVISENFEYDVRNYFKNFKRGVFVDVGSNMGKYTIMISNQLKENGKIISIEPHPENFETLEKNVRLNNCKNIILLNLACWNKKDILKLYSHENHPLLSSAVKPSKNYIKVNANSLDNILKQLKVKNVDLVKIDVEGAESNVLNGMKNVLKSGKAKIIFEVWSDMYLSVCKKILENYNYKIKHLDKMYWMGVHKYS